MERRQPAVHRTVMVVDVERFGDSRRTNPHKVSVRAGLYATLRKAFDQAQVSWSVFDCQDTGDGVFILAPAHVPKALFVDVVPHAVAIALREHNATHPAEEQIRLRMALHAGEVTYDEHGVTATAVISAFRLLDAPQVKATLAASPGVLALITSGWFFDEVVRHSQDVDPATFRPVWVAVKETSMVGWISRPDHPYPPTAEHLTTRPPSEAAGSVPHQLPAAPRSFTGRIKELSTLTAALETTAESGGGTVVISAIAGAGGMGKTWLALHWAHEHLDRFPDGQLFVDLRGFSPDSKPMAVEVAVRGFLDAFGVDPVKIPLDPHAQAARYRSLVAGKRMLILLDNAADTSQIVPLLPGSPGATVLVTSRNQLPGLTTAHGARHLPVDVLSDIEARTLLTTRLGAEQVAAEPAAVDDLLAACGGFPLALSIVAGRAQPHPNLALFTLTAELHEAGLGALDGDDPAASLPTVLSWSYSALTHEQARVFGLLAIAPGPDISLAAAASLTDLPIAHTRTVLRGLEQTSLLNQDTFGRYGMHDLIRRFATDCAHHDQPERVRRTAQKQLINFYLHAAHASDRLLDPHRTPIQLNATMPDHQLHPLSDFATAMAWFDAENPCLLAAQQTATAHDWHQAVWQLAWTLTTFRHRQGHLHDNHAAWRAGLAAANHLNDPVAQVLAHGQLGRACALVGRHGEALDHLQQAIMLADSTHDFPNLAYAHHTLAWTLTAQMQYRRALEHATRALFLYQTLDSPVWEASALNQVGWCAAQLGEYELARQHCEAALTVHRRHDDHDGVAATLDSLGYITYNNGHAAHALDYYQRSLTLHRERGNTYETADVLDRVGHPLVDLNQHEQARTAWEEALDLYQAHHRLTDADRVQQQLNTLATNASATPTANRRLY